MQPPNVTVLVTVGQVLSDAGCQRVHDRFIPRVTEHDVLVTGTIKIIHRLLAVAARLLALVKSLALRHRDVHTVIRLNPSRSMVSAPLALIRANDPVLVPSGPNPLVMLVRHLLLLGVAVCLQDLFFVAIISVASPLGRISVVIITHRHLGIDGCRHHLCLVARTCALPLGYAFCVLF